MDFGLKEVPNLENMYFHIHAVLGWGTSQGPKSVMNAAFFLSPIL